MDSLMGEIFIYKSGADQEGYIELVGINSSSRVKKIKKLMPYDLDLVLIDGALDRRSSAMPALTDGFIMATGAVVGNTEELVIKRTIHEKRKLTLAKVYDNEIRDKVELLIDEGRDGILYSDGRIAYLDSKTSFGHIKELKEKDLENITALIINGALIDSFVEKLIYSLEIKDLDLIVRDGTRVFLNKRSMNLLENSEIRLKVLNSIQLLAVTVNPTSPYSPGLDSMRLVSGLQDKLNNIPVYDILSEEYQSIRGDEFAGKVED